MRISKETSSMINRINIGKLQLSIFMRYAGRRSWMGRWKAGEREWVYGSRGSGSWGIPKEYLSELKSSLNQIKKQ
jgi:hypothetical protein